MDGGKMYLGHLLKVPVYVGFEALFLLAFGYYRYQSQPLWIMLIGITALLLTILLHELGHALMAQAFRMPGVSITISAMGGYCSYLGEPPPMRKVLITAAGPLTNFALMALSYGLLRAGIFTEEITLTFLVQMYFWNLVLGVLNSFPLYPLDGGQVALALAKASCRSTAQANRVTLGLSVVAAVGMLTLDYFLLGGPNAWNIILVATLLYTAYMQLR